MAQLVQLQESEQFAAHDANVIVIFRAEAEGQDGLRKVADLTKTEFTLALDMEERTKCYSAGEMVHDSYIIDSEGVIRAILPGKRYDRAHVDDFLRALNELQKRGQE